MLSYSIRRATLVLVFLLSLTRCAPAQSFTYWLSGSADDVDTAHQSGLVLAGGGGDNDDAMRWMLQRADGGDVVVLRASGSDGYNPYFFSELGVTVNSVETLRFNDASAAEDPFVLSVIAGAEVLFIAGGDQTVYVDYWRDSPVAAALATLQHVKQITIGGTSAGMAILGQVYYAPTGSGIVSDEALNNPFHPFMSNVVTNAPLFDYPWLKATVTDTHYDQRDRRGRHLVFLARVAAESGGQVFGVAANEYTAIAIEPEGIARVFGEFPDFPDFAYFIQSGCGQSSGPEILQPNQPIHWDRDQSALTVYRIGGTPSATGYLDLNNWRQGDGGEWLYWWASDGVMGERGASAPAPCAVANPDKLLNPALEIELGQPAGVRP